MFTLIRERIKTSPLLLPLPCSLSLPRLLFLAFFWIFWRYFVKLEIHLEETECGFRNMTGRVMTDTLITRRLRGGGHSCYIGPPLASESLFLSQHLASNTLSLTNTYTRTHPHIHTQTRTHTRTHTNKQTDANPHPFIVPTSCFVLSTISLFSFPSVFLYNTFPIPFSFCSLSLSLTPSV